MLIYKKEWIPLRCFMSLGYPFFSSPYRKEIERFLSGYIFLLDDDVFAIVKEVDTGIGEGELCIDREGVRCRFCDIHKGGIDSLFQILILRFSTLISIIIDGNGFLTGDEEMIILTIPESFMELIGCIRDFKSTCIGLI